MSCSFLVEGNKMAWFTSLLTLFTIAGCCDGTKPGTASATTEGSSEALLGGYRVFVLSLAFSPDGKTLATAGGPWSGSEGGPGEVVLWDTATGRQKAKFTGYRNWVRSAAFSADGTYLATGGIEILPHNGGGPPPVHSDLRIWDIASGLQIARLESVGKVNSVAFSPNRKWLATAEGGTAVLWDLRSKKRRIPGGPTKPGAMCVAFSSDGTKLASGGSDKDVTLWDVATRKQIGKLTGHKNYVVQVAFAHDGKRIASVGFHGTVKLWDTTTRRESATFGQPSEKIRCLALSPDGKTLAFGGDAKEIKLWNIVSMTELLTIKLNAELEALAFSPDGKMLASSAADAWQPGYVKLWDIATGNEVVSPQ